MNPVLAEFEQYPFTRLDEWKADAVARGIELIDFGVGDPRERTPPFIRDTMLRSIPEISSYPKAAGLPELRKAIARWVENRYGMYADAETEIIPTLGSKEAIFSIAQLTLGEKRVVAIPEPAYPVYERGARFAGAEVITIPLSQRKGWVPNIDTIDCWDEIGMFWVCYPNNPTGAVAPLSFYEEMAELAQTHDFLLCSDEAYSELYFDEAPASALELDDRSNVIVFNTLSKRSSMTGYRSGFMCAPAEITAAIKKFRPTVGTAPQDFVQKASIAAWSDERHVKEIRAIYSRKRDVMLPALESQGWLLAGSAATFFLWVETNGPSEPFARRLLEHGIVCAPGSFFGPAGEGYARFALVPTQGECERAAEIIMRHL